VIHLPNANAAALALARGDATLMVAAQGQTLDIPWLKPDELVQVAVLGTVPTPCFVGLRQVPPVEMEAFRRALLAFVPLGGQGASGAAYVEGSPRDLEPFETFAAEVRRMLGPAR